jgi:hypothetical protein
MALTGLAALAVLFFATRPVNVSRGEVGSIIVD